ncbi:NAD(P)/FAD-dependent oxidoreductase [Oleisolibacter albus]|uniref:NAD(P)/FAD-dependent oxidoreductase n=1 Tax=Oleisolibacter albus TaxID=2171757 RepID=UPI00187356FB|nr:FAD-dependent oxidoreductase [Oleisolibacter albus]
MRTETGRRHLLLGGGAALGLGLLGGCAGGPPPAATPAGPALNLLPPRLSPDRITHITVCSRPFRAAGPRIERERIGSKDVIHQYGHGGSGWSLSWGSAQQALALVQSTGTRDVAVIGCGAIGLTTALVLQRAGLQVSIYARDLPPETPSSYASGVWSPDSRICLAQNATPDFKARWERMCRDSFRSYQTLLGLPGSPVEWIDSYYVPADRPEPPPDPRPAFAELRRDLVPDLSLRGQSYGPGQHPFGTRTVRRSTFMMFNIGPYSRLLIADFLAGGGRIAVQTFHSPADFAALPQPTLVNCTGYGARALMRDSSVIPVRGQLARLVPQPEITYGLFHDQVSFVPRRDGLVVQQVGPNDYYGFDDSSTIPDRAEAEQAVRTLAGLFAAV